MTWSSGLPYTLSIANCAPYTPGDAPCYPNGNAGSLSTHVGPYNPVTHNRLYFNGNLSAGQLPTGFSYPTLDHIGSAGRNNKFGPSFFNVDMSLQKNFPIYETLLAQFRFDAYNVINKINLANPGGGIDQGPQYISGMAPGANPRQLQFSLRLLF